MKKKTKILKEIYKKWENCEKPFECEDFEQDADFAIKLAISKVSKGIFKGFREMECGMCGKAIYCVDGETVCQEFLDLEKEWCD